jgi:hypothetical protein
MENKTTPILNVKNVHACTVKPEYNDHPWDPKELVVVQGWSLLTGKDGWSFAQV